MSFKRREQLQNTQPLIYMSLNKNSVYCDMPLDLHSLPTHVSVADQSGRVFCSLAKRKKG